LTIEHQVAQNVRAVPGTAVEGVVEVKDRVIEELIHEPEDHEVTAMVVVVGFVGFHESGDDVIKAITFEPAVEVEAVAELSSEGAVADAVAGDVIIEINGAAPEMLQPAIVVAAEHGVI